MKRLVLVLSAFMLAGIARAASFDWTFAPAGSNRDAYIGYYVYVVVDGPEGALSQNLGAHPFTPLDQWKETWNSWQEIYDASMYELDSHEVKTDQLYKTHRGKVVINGSAVYLDVGYWDFYYVVVDSAKTKYWYSEKQNAFVETETNANPMPVFNYNLDDANWTMFPSAEVPEPATAALLAFGLAAFGLKRKVRA